MELDLLTWPEVDAARAVVADRHARQVEAERRYRLSPHGERQARLKALQEAVQGSLEAELALAALVREA